MKPKFKHQNEEEIKAYLAQHNLSAECTDTGLYYHLSAIGEGKQPNEKSNISIAYIGYLCNGDIFDQNTKLEINLQDVIPGWTEGIQHFNEGSEGILFVPAHLAYGDTDYGSIPGGSVLIFDIQLIKVHS
ncbi:FKBP-type peptidyl-prolyl cis-trans isomerase [Labilibacter marinus]|uniref:FKBP-type peptidyl-prolyl cis-trans isomerase n=1 Tax=Labilibacter marinus TaxID=1477105 RepID=UPI000950110A|nr:FKBP-type peptidyl-prolyl cis-trans isomerase [Labilibacter marinus]